MPCARENDGRKLDHQTLEVMRLRAVDAVESGVHPEDVAASLGMGRGTVYGWLARYREALKARPVPGGSRSCPVSRCAGSTR
jgi:transposase